MYIALNQFELDGSLKVDYREDHDHYIVNLGKRGLLILGQHELEELYNEILDAWMHKRYSGEIVEVTEWVN